MLDHSKTDFFGLEASYWDGCEKERKRSYQPGAILTAPEFTFDSRRLLSKINGNFFIPKMSQFPHGAGQTPTNLPEALGLGQLTKQHGHKVIPGSISFSVSFGAMANNQLIEAHPAELSDQLTK